MRRRWYAVAAMAATLVVGLVGATPAAAAQAEGAVGDQPVMVDQARTTVVEDVSPDDHGYCNNTSTFGRSIGYIRLPSIGSGGTTHCVMAQGAQSSGVTALQVALVNCYGLSTGGVDGIFGPSTYSALRTAQSIEGITVDGVYGPQTRNALWWPVWNWNGSFTGYCSTY